MKRVIILILCLGMFLRAGLGAEDLKRILIGEVQKRTLMVRMITI
jgi:hypothetical protein